MDKFALLAVGLATSVSCFAAPLSGPVDAEPPLPDEINLPPAGCDILVD